MPLTDESLTRFFQILASSKLPSELSELNSPTANHFIVIQEGTSDAQKITLSKVRGALGTYNANTNTPALQNGTALEGDSYVVTASGVRDFGAGSMTLSTDDVISYHNGKWIKTFFNFTKQFLLDTLGFTPEDTSFKGQADGYVPLNAQSKVDSIYLPAFVEEIIEGTYVNSTTFNDDMGNPVTPSKSKIYLDTTSSIAYRFGGTNFVDIKASPGSTDDVVEGATNKYFTDARVLSAVLVGLSTATSSAVVDGDSVIQAFGKLQAQINDLITSVANFGNEVQAYDDLATGEEGILYLDSTNDIVYQWKAGAYHKLGVDQATFYALETRVQALEDANGVTVKEHQVNGVRVDNTNVSGTYNIDWDAISLHNLTLTNTTTFEDVNLPTGTNVKVCEIRLTGDWPFTFPAYYDQIPGDAYDGAISNKIIISVIDGTEGTKKVEYQIINNPA